MKIISGKLKGRNIDGYNIEGTRPTMDRVKESIFASIQSYINNAIVLDLFSGSGNLGFEAISNGSKLCYFNDHNYKCIKSIQDNINKFNIKDQSITLNLDYMKCLNYLKDHNIKLDLIFLDPPYKLNIIDEIIEFIINNDLLNNNGLIICEMTSILTKEYNNLKLIKEKNYSEKNVYIYKKIEL